MFVFPLLTIPPLTDPVSLFSTWLRKTRDGSTRLSRWVWVIGIFLLVVRIRSFSLLRASYHFPQCIGAAIGIGYHVSHDAPSHQQPKVFGGSADESAVPSLSQPTPTAAGGPSATSLHVQPTFTVARRALEPSGLPASQNLANAMHNHKKRMHMH